LRVLILTAVAARVPGSARFVAKVRVPRIYRELKNKRVSRGLGCHSTPLAGPMQGENGAGRGLDVALEGIKLSAEEEERIRENLKSCWNQFPAEMDGALINMFKMGVASLMDHKDQESRTINIARLRERLAKAKTTSPSPPSLLLGGSCDTETLAEVLVMFDRNGDGEIDFVEACECFMFYAELGLGRSLAEQKRVVFSIMDEDNDGNVSLKELRGFVRMALRTGLIGPNELETLAIHGGVSNNTVDGIAEAYLKLMDLDQDSTISFQEFCAFSGSTINWELFSNRFNSRPKE